MKNVPLPTMFQISGLEEEKAGTFGKGEKQMDWL